MAGKELLVVFGSPSFRQIRFPEVPNYEIVLINVIPEKYPKPY
jgi:hypothetical protein